MSRALVGVNLLWLVPGHVGGSEESMVASLRGLHDLAPPDLDIRLFALDSFGTAHPEVAAAFSTDLVRVPWGARPLRVALESTWLAARARGFALVHHAGGTAPVLPTTPYVLTVHDIQPLVATATHGTLKRAYLRATVPRSVRGARQVVVPSEFVRRTLLDRLGVDPSRVVVIPHAVDVDRLANPTAGDVRARFELDGPVVLYPAITYPHKDHLTLVRAFAQVLATQPTAVLVLMGGEAASEAEVMAEIRRLGIESRVRRTGRVSEADVAGLYHEATLVAVPSRYEGFGLPAAEAMAAGVPLVVADAAALPEVVGDAGLVVAPGDVPGWAAAIDRLLSDPARRRQSAERGRVRARRWASAAHAEALVEVYRRALADRH